MKRIEAEEVIRFLNTLHAFQGVRRVMHVPGEDRFENDVEHSYLLAMSVWHAIETFDLPLDKDKCIRYALAHDLPEVHAGDTYVFLKDQRSLDSKKEREAAARAKLRSDFPTVPGMHEAMENYEHLVDKEAIFVRSFDKIMPMLTNYLQDGRTLKQEGVCYSQIEELKLRTTEHCPEVHDVVKQILALYNVDRARYFGENVH